MLIFSSGNNFHEKLLGRLRKTENLFSQILKFFYRFLQVRGEGAKSSE